MLGPGLGALIWIVLFLFAFNSFFRGMRALEQIATRLERIEHILAKGSPSGPGPSASRTAT